MPYAIPMRTLLLLAVAASMVGCGHINIGMGSGVKGSGKVVKKTISVGSFNAISADSVGAVEVQVGAAQKIEIETDDNILPLLENTVDGNELTLDTKESINPTKLVYRITVPSLEKMHLAGVGEAEVTGIDGKTFSASIEGVGGMKLKGKTDELTAEVSGVGGLNAEDLTAKSVKVEVSGVGGAQVHATDTLDAKCSGVGGIDYKGDPKVTKSVSGVGGVSKSG